MKQQILPNPITEHFLHQLYNCNDELLIAVPFISSFIPLALKRKDLDKIKIKRLITRFDEYNLNSFELASHNKKWERYFIRRGRDIIHNLG